MNDSARARKLRRRLFAALLGGGLALASIFVVLTIRGAARAPILTEQRFEAALKRWRERQPRDYDITVKVTGRQPGTYRVRVRNGLARAATLNGQPLKSRRTWGTWSAAGMFDTIRIDLRNNRESGHLMLRAEFDDEFGYPAWYQRIELRTGAHDALHWEVMEFTPPASS